MTPFIMRIQYWDERTIRQIIAARGSVLTPFMKFISRVGDGYVWALLAVLFSVAADVPAGWLSLGLTAFAVELLCYKLIKQTTTRPRPFRALPGIQNLVIPQDEYSFPSGHTAAATVAAFLFGTAIPVLAPFFAALALLIGLSRIYLGVHFPSDVLMGFFLGAFSIGVSTMLHGML
ncbi:MAG: phosphatase PAP2 family protein [Bacteroidetes bacterium]|nr:phosphatase PAP2 family protein [Bacteroidota bacterium]